MSQVAACRKLVLTDMRLVFEGAYRAVVIFGNWTPVAHNPTGGVKLMGRTVSGGMKVLDMSLDYIRDFVGDLAWEGVGVRKEHHGIEWEYCVV